MLAFLARSKPYASGTLENTFTISAKNNSVRNYYIQSARLNGKDYRHNYIQFDDIRNGGDFLFNLDENPNENWGNQPENVPYSLSRKKQN